MLTKICNHPENYQFSKLNELPKAPREPPVRKPTNVLQNQATKLPQLLVH